MDKARDNACVPGYVFCVAAAVVFVQCGES